MARSKSIDRKTLSDMFLKGADRKMLEHEMFTLRIVEKPEREPIYRELIDYVDIDERYYRMASQYYLGDLDTLDNGFNEDLLLLTKASELPPKLYAEYLRELSPDDRASEKITHAALKELKSTMRKVLEAML